MKNYIIFGDSPFAERLSKYILFEGVDNLLGFTQDDEFCSRYCILDLPVIPLSKLKERFDDGVEILLAVGYTQMNDLRERIYRMLKNKGFRIGSWVSVNAISYSNLIGEGSIILPNTMIGPGCEIGKCNFLESSVSISHDNNVGDFNFFSTSVVVGGMATIKNHCFFGLNSTIKSDIVMNDYTLLGSACNMLKDSISMGAYVGNPARLLQKRSVELKI